MLEEDIRVPTSIDCCTLVPTPRNVPTDPNPNTCDEEIRFAQPTTDEKDNNASNQLHDDTTDHGTHDHSLHFIRIVDHVAHNDGRVTYNVQMSDRSIHKEVDMHDLPYRIVIQYWHKTVNPKRDPNLRKRGRPKKKQ